MVQQKNQNLDRKGWLTLILILLICLRFMGFAPIANTMNKNLPILIGVISLYIGIRYDYKSEYGKCLWLILLAFVLNGISSAIFRQTPFSEIIFSQCNYYDLFIFFVIIYLRPSIEDVGKIIIIFGSCGLILYFIQYLIMPIYIVESLTTGWRAREDTFMFDIMRYSVTGETISILMGFYYFNRLLEKVKLKYVLIFLCVSVMLILHGYRGYLIAYVIGLLVTYIRYTGKILSRKLFVILFLLVLLSMLYSATTVFDDVLVFLSEKNERQREIGVEDIDRVVEIKYFLNDFLVSPFEWLFGSGFLQMSQYTGRQNVFAFINWVDLGFFGMTFVGGIFMVVVWLRMLFLNLRRLPSEYSYISGFTVFLILGSIVMSAAFSNKACVVEALSFYLCYKIRTDYGIKDNSYI